MIDLRQVRAALSHAEHAVEMLDGRDVMDGPDLQQDRPALSERRREVAEASRELLRLADNLALASALVRNEYHVLKGAPDALTHR